jgi:transcriptional regulator with XRE-family HTH domain
VPGPNWSTTRQIKAARALLGWPQSDLAEKSGVSEPTVARLESADCELGGREVTAKKNRRAFELPELRSSGQTAMVPACAFVSRKENHLSAESIR